MRHRMGFTMIELIVVLAIMAVLIALLLVAVQQVREAAVRLDSSNKIKQMTLAMHSFADAQDGRLPHVNGTLANGAPGEQSVFFAFLPYLKQEHVYKRYLDSPRRANHILLRTFLSPADPTLAKLLADEGLSSYAANAQVFTNNPSLTTTFRDGTSNTLAFAEHYARDCGPGSYFYYAMPHCGGSRRATFADGGPNIDSYANCGDYWPETIGSPPEAWPLGRKRQLTFQVRPSPVIENCNPHLANTPHRSGMLVGIADGSVRTLSPAIATPLYWGAITPSGGEVLADW